MTLLATALLAAMLLSTTAVQLLFKAVAARGTHEDLSKYWLALFADPLLWLGLAIYVAELLLYMALLSIVPLWQGVMVISFNVILVMIGGRFFFAEKLTRARVLAVLLIATGVFLVGWGGP